MATKTKKKTPKKAVKKDAPKRKVTVKKKSTKTEEKPVLEVWIEESYVHYMSKGPLFISAETHPELEGMTLDEMKDYVLENAYEMSPVNSSYSENMIEELQEFDTVKDKILDEETNICFNN